MSLELCSETTAACRETHLFYFASSSPVLFCILRPEEILYKNGIILIAESHGGAQAGTVIGKKREVWRFATINL